MEPIAPETATLRDRPEFLDIVACWIDGEWARFSGRSLSQTRARFEQETRSGAAGLPMTVIALQAEEALGVATLRERDSADWDPQVTPWICNVYVPPQARGIRIASHLCRALEEQAVKLGYGTVYLANAIGPNSLYGRLGYEVYAERPHPHERQYLMRKEL